uniref:Uncharacterized protein n=1 Tax=Pavo cristatus TaxID=9049 RepID=A0A8C9LA88_PAVCR
SLCQRLHQHQGNIPSTAHPEVLGVHMQLVTVQLGQLGEGVLDVVQVLHSIPKGGEHFLAMGADHGVAQDGGGAGEVSKGGKEPLGPGVDNQQPGFGPAFGHIDLAPEADDELLLLSSPVHHGGGWRVASQHVPGWVPLTQFQTAALCTAVREEITTWVCWVLPPSTPAACMWFLSLPLPEGPPRLGFSLFFPISY